ncbi:MAG: acetyl-CoA carboxylase biotin carboxyl carrier protein [Chloroflexota bacterium]|jgi:acetyl-CoA carboxylase biotin carboxyl carrier protein
MSLQFNLDGIGSDQIARLMELLAHSDIEECEIEQDDCKVSLKRVLQTDTPQITQEAEALHRQGEKAAEQAVIPASAVGLFFRSEKHSGPPKVDAGDKVMVGDVIGFIQVVNVPHAVHSPYEGIIESFLAENGQPVEYGQPLVSLKI